MLHDNAQPTAAVPVADEEVVLDDKLVPTADEAHYDNAHDEKRNESDEMEVVPHDNKAHYDGHGFCLCHSETPSVHRVCTSITHDE